MGSTLRWGTVRKLVEVDKMAFVSVRNVSKRFGSGISEVTALDGVNLTLDEGEFISVWGHNGAGKTTTMKMIYCISPKTAGKLEVAGIDVDEDPRRIKGLIGVAPQENNLDPDFTVLENLIVYSRYFNIPRNEAQERAENLLEFFKLEEKRHTIIERISTGMKRRLILARALLNEPRVLVLDEPTIGQDHQQKEKLLQFILQMKEQKKTVIIVTHDVEFVAECNPRVVLMHHGRIVADGEADKVLTNPEILTQASIVPPQITQIFLQLSDYQLPREVIDIYEAQKVLLKAMEGKRDKVSEYLKENGIASAIYYPLCLHLQEVYKDLGYKSGDFTIAEKIQNEVLSLPMYSELEEKEIEEIVARVKEVL